MRSIVDVLQRRAEETPRGIAFVWLADGETEASRVTYAWLDEQARAIAGALEDRVHPGERVLLLYPPGLEFIAGFFGCLYAGVIAVPLYPPRSSGTRRPSALDSRIDAVLADAEPSLCLTR